MCVALVVTDNCCFCFGEDKRVVNGIVGKKMISYLEFQMCIQMLPILITFDEVKCIRGRKDRIGRGSFFDTRILVTLVHPRPHFFLFFLGGGEWWTTDQNIYKGHPSTNLTFFFIITQSSLLSSLLVSSLYYSNLSTCFANSLPIMMNSKSPFCMNRN
jgi:hypothetical protein